MSKNNSEKHFSSKAFNSPTHKSNIAQQTDDHSLLGKSKLPDVRRSINGQQTKNSEGHEFFFYNQGKLYVNTPSTSKIQLFENEEKTTSLNVQILNDELLLRIFMLLQTKDLKNASMVCRKWRELGATLLWKRMVFPMDKKILSSMKSFLISNGKYITSAMIVPPINMLTATTLATGGLSIPITGSSSKNDSWSIPKPLSRSGSISSFSGTVPHSPRSSNLPNYPSSSRSSFLKHRPAFNYEDRDFSKNYYLNNEDAAINNNFRAIANIRDLTDDQSSIYSNFPYISDSDSIAQLATPDRRNSAVLNFINQERQDRQDPSASEELESNSYSLADMRIPSSSQKKPINLSNISTAIGQSAAIPIPGTPGVGNTLSTELPSSCGSSCRLNVDLGSASNYSNFFTEKNRFHRISNSTIVRLQQYLECYCPNIIDLTVLNPNGLTNHDSRIELLEQLFSTYPNLLHLNLSDFIMWDVEATNLVAQSLHSLRSINLTNRVEIGDQDMLSVIENCYILEEIKVRATNISDVFIETVEERLFSTLKVLDIGGCAISSKALSNLVKKAYNLVELRAWSCLRINDDFLLSLNSNFLSRLKILDLMDINGFSNDVIYKIFGLQKWQNLEYLRIRAKCDSSLFSGLSKTAILKLNPTSILD
ncbi:hypothetical protein BB561_006008 [Smittium simulii]|uniref:F-box domain-containing protein n=1 Tax=Smittium simulii TaxID=133385 RepID=A0A2T9Y755_9FUNG|nr:hypothetical protein BB561_006008 [Smittium simulii]